MHYADANNVNVVARTEGAHRKYYYGRMEEGSWLPWEQIKLDIEDNPIIPVVWKGRLLLLWLKILKMGPRTAQKFKPNQDGSPPDLNKLSPDNLPDDPQITVGAVLCWSEYYNGKWQPTKTSNIDLPAMFLSGAPGGIQHYAASEQMPAKNGAAPPDPPTFNRAALRLGITGEGDALRIFVSDRPEVEGPNANWTAFLLLNTNSLPETEDDNTAPEYSNVNLGDVWNARLLHTSTDNLN